MKQSFWVLSFILLSGVTNFAKAVLLTDSVIIKIVPDHKDWVYKKGNHARFNVSVSGMGTEKIKLIYEIGPEKMPPTKTGVLERGNGNYSIDGGTLDYPGILRCVIKTKIGAREYRELTTAAFDPGLITATAKMPADFMQFWNRVKMQTAGVPLNVELTKLSKRTTSLIDVYHVAYQIDKTGKRFYGIVCIPAKKGKFPAVIRFPGAGVTPLSGNIELAEKGFIVFDIYIHEFPANLEKSFYDSLATGPLKGYPLFGAENPDSFYYKRVLTGCLKAVDFIKTLPKFDGAHIASWGSSQGGFLSVATTALDNRISCLVVLCPAMSDLTGYLHNRAGGWPHVLNSENRRVYNSTKVSKALSYYDTVNFAKLLKVPGFYSWGFNDETTPPTSLYSVYNVITAPKELVVIPDGKHAIYKEQRDKSYTWLVSRLKQ